MPQVPDERAAIEADREAAPQRPLNANPVEDLAHDGVLTADGRHRCMNVSPSTGKRCKLAVGHFETHLIDL